MRIALRSIVFSFVIFCTSRTALGAEKNNFVLTNTGRPIGTASYTIDKVKSGYRERSQFAVGDSQKDADFTVDANGNFVNGYMQDDQTQAMSTFQVDKSRTSLMVTLAHVYNSQTLALAKPDFLVLPNFDPGAIQLLLITLLNHPHADSLYYLVIPGQDSTENNAVRINAAADADGTLDGKPISLKHFHMVYLKGTAELFTDADGKLMEADMDILHTYYVRAKFIIGKH
jgi:hypothetical protein